MQFGKVRSLDEVKTWLSMGSHNSKITYFIGELCNAAQHAAFEQQQDEIGQIRALMYEAFQRNEIHLFQKRLPADVFGFEYIAIKRSKGRYKKDDGKFRRLLNIASKTKHEETFAHVRNTRVPETEQSGSEDNFSTLAGCIRCAEGWHASVS